MRRAGIALIPFARHAYSVRHLVQLFRRVREHVAHQHMMESVDGLVDVNAHRASGTGLKPHIIAGCRWILRRLPPHFANRGRYAVAIEEFQPSKLVVLQSIAGPFHLN
jgi:hypothetical protein